MSLGPEARAFMEAQHPGVVRRWLATSGSPVRHGSRGKGAANPRKRPARLPKVGGRKRDFGRLKPSSVARHVPKAASEHEAMLEDPVGFQVGAFPHKLGKPGEPSGLAGRDVRAAAARRLTKR
jgi:hypothetical protein